jgi:hypothetical protein
MVGGKALLRGGAGIKMRICLGGRHDWKKEMVRMRDALE